MLHIHVVCKSIIDNDTRRYAISDVSMICRDTYKVFICISVQRENMFLSNMYAGKLLKRLSLLPLLLVCPCRVQCAVFRLKKPLAKLLLLLLLDDVYMPIMATSKHRKERKSPSPSAPF